MRARMAVRLGAVAVSIALATVVAVGAGLGVTRPAAGASAKTEDCRTRGRTVAANRTTRLFYTGDRVTDARKYYACWIARRRAIFVTANDSYNGALPSIVLAGQWVAYETSICDDGECSGQVFVFDSRAKGDSGLRLVEQFERFAAATDLALTDDGTVAWIRRDYEAGTRGVTVVGRGKAPRRLDVGLGIEEGSLALAGRYLYWSNEGSPRRALAQ